MFLNLVIILMVLEMIVFFIFDRRVKIYLKKNHPEFYAEVSLLATGLTYNKFLKALELRGDIQQSIDNEIKILKLLIKIYIASLVIFFLGIFYSF